MNPEKFNEAMQKGLLRYGIAVNDCRMQILGNVETDATNLHSFFIDDLEKAKRIRTANLEAYLYGNKEGRRNLDSKKDSVNFNPHMFEQILQPKNYPMGRFPGQYKVCAFSDAASCGEFMPSVSTISLYEVSTVRPEPKKRHF